MKNRDGKVYLSNDKVKDFPLPETYLSPRNQGQTTSQKDKFVVPKDHVLVFGDNRDQSLDARRCFSDIGCFNDKSPYIEISKIKGKTEFVVWPFWSTSELNSGFRFFKNEFDEILPEN